MLQWKKIKKFGMYEKIIKFKNTGKTILGICLGMQLLTTKSYEGKETRGFDFIEAEVTFIKEDINKIKKMIKYVFQLMDGTQFFSIIITKSYY